MRTLLAELGRPDLAPLCARGPGLHQRPVIDFLESVFAERSQAEWIEWFRGRDVCFAPVKTLREAVDDEQARARGMVITDAAGREHLAPVIKFRDAAGAAAACCAGARRAHGGDRRRVERGVKGGVPLRAPLPVPGRRRSSRGP